MNMHLNLSDNFRTNTTRISDFYRPHLLGPKICSFVVCLSVFSRHSTCVYGNLFKCFDSRLPRSLLKSEYKHRTVRKIERSVVINKAKHWRRMVQKDWMIGRNALLLLRL